MKKIIFAIVVLLILMISGCSNGDSAYTPYNESNGLNNNESIILGAETTLASGQCSARNLNDKIIMFESEYCGHCKTAKPILKQIAEERDLEILFLDISQKEDRARMKNFGISVKYTPTLLINCNVIIGSREKAEYEEIFNKFLEK